MVMQYVQRLRRDDLGTCNLAQRTQKDLLEQVFVYLYCCQRSPLVPVPLHSNFREDSLLGVPFSETMFSGK